MAHMWNIPHIKKIFTTKKEKSVIYSPSCHSKPVRLFLLLILKQMLLWTSDEGFEVGRNISVFEEIKYVCRMSAALFFWSLRYFGQEFAFNFCLFSSMLVTIDFYIDKNKSLKHFSKYLPSSSTEERKSYRFRITWGWINNAYIIPFYP